MEKESINAAELLKTLKNRFEKNTSRHLGVNWTKIEEKLLANPKAISTLLLMEKTGGEPDVIKYEKQSDQYTFCDCCVESPRDRRSLCYDNQALDSRKEFKPSDSAENMAKKMGADLLTVNDYEYLQTVGEFDQKTSSWLKTPEKIRKLGGAIFGDRRYDTVFIYHNGAESYYASRGFRCKVNL